MTPPIGARLRRLVAVMTTAAALLTWAAAPAAAGDAVARRGECDGPSRWALSVRRVDAGILRVRLAIASGPVGDVWNVFMDDNGRGFFSGSRTSGPGGLVVVRRRTADLAGDDRITAGAHDTDTGETCTARVTLR